MSGPGGYSHAAIAEGQRLRDLARKAGADTAKSHAVSGQVVEDTAPYTLAQRYVDERTDSMPRWMLEQCQKAFAAGYQKAAMQANKGPSLKLQITIELDPLSMRDIKLQQIPAAEVAIALLAGAHRQPRSTDWVTETTTASIDRARWDFV